MYGYYNKTQAEIFHFRFFDPKIYSTASSDLKALTRLENYNRNIRTWLQLLDNVKKSYFKPKK